MTSASKPVIAVTGPHHWFRPGWWALNIALRCLGAKPLYFHSRNHLSLSSKPIQGIIISGGSDIEPIHFAADPLEHYRYDRERDHFEMQMIEQALSANIPLLGICRGMQLINVVYGGNLYLNISQQRQFTSNRPSVLPQKWAMLAPHTLLKNCIGGNYSRLKINSLHRQAINALGSHLKAVAHDADGFIQAVEHTQDWVVGVQWHPEYLTWAKPQRQLFKALIEASRKTPKEGS